MTHRDDTTLPEWRTFADTWSADDDSAPAAPAVVPHRYLPASLDGGKLPATDEPAVIGRGGLGVVLCVHDQELGRAVALKALHPGTGSPGAVARFLREARVTSQLEHPSIVPVYDLGQRADGTLYYTMKRVVGRTLRQAIEECAGAAARLSLLEHLIDVCQAMAYAHDRGVVHRDLKPDNIMVGAFGETIVLDWGIARVGIDDLPLEPELSSLSGGTRVGSVLGTPGYLSPEQARGEPIDGRSDIWALGAIS